MLPGESLRRISAADKRAEEALVAGLPVSGNCNSSALHLLARLQRTRSFRRPPYVDSVRKRQPAKNGLRQGLLQAVFLRNRLYVWKGVKSE